MEEGGGSGVLAHCFGCFQSQGKMSGFFCLKIIVDPPLECAIFRVQSGQFRPDGVPGAERFWGAQSATGLESVDESACLVNRRRARYPCGLRGLVPPKGYQRQGDYVMSVFCLEHSNGLSALNQKTDTGNWLLQLNPKQEKISYEIQPYPQFRSCGFMVQF
jgi:hypothetical protein